jgi:hypothetical protein
MLVELGHFDESYEDPIMRGQQEYCKRLLRLCGIWHETNVIDIVHSMFDWAGRKKRKMVGDIVRKWFGIEMKPGSEGS